MRTQLTNVRANSIRPLLTATLALAITFTLSCSSGDDPEDSGGGNVVYGEPVVYGNETYQTVVIGTQTWMAENLNYDTGTDGSRCYDNNPANCDTYGRLYNWATANTVCPSSWHLPSNAEWDALATYIEGDKGCTRCDAKHLKAASGWNSDGNGLDSYGFAALPGGHGSSDGSFINVGNLGYWWSASEAEAILAHYRGMGDFNGEFAYWDGDYKDDLLNVRCVMD
jgi:uncharacterized protein (TIGR02145 family)